MLAPSPNLVQKAFSGTGTSPMFTSTPRRKGESHKSKETKVFLTVKYPSQPVNKELKDNYAVISEAIINGSPQLIAQAVVKRDTLKIYC